MAAEDIRVEPLSIEQVCKFGMPAACGFRPVTAEDGQSVIEVDITDNLRNPIGSVHGGAVFALADTTGGSAVRSYGIWGCTTVSATINYMRPTVNTKKLVAKGEVIKAGKRLSTVEVKVYDENDVLMCQMIGTYANMNPDRTVR